MKKLKADAWVRNSRGYNKPDKWRRKLLQTIDRAKIFDPRYFINLDSEIELLESIPHRTKEEEIRLQIDKVVRLEKLKKT